MIFFIENLLSGPDLATVRKIAETANYVDGLASARYSKETKNNLEMEPSGSQHAMLVNILNGAVDTSAKVRGRILPRSRVSHPIISRYDRGMYYREHVDSPIIGPSGRFGQNFVRADYSMTLFLSPPESYDGGELELQFGERKEQIKLSAGSAVVYQTGIPHSVSPITRGSRICALYWFQSLIRDTNIRRTLWELRCLEQKLQESGNGHLAEESASVRHNLIRYLAEV